MSGRSFLPTRRLARRLVFCMIGMAIACIAGVAVASADDAPRTVAPAVPFPTPEVRAWQTGLIRPDRIQHASFAMTLGLSAGLPSRSPAAAFATGFVLGLAKEFWDARRDHFDPWDLLADTAGAAASATITQALHD